MKIEYELPSDCYAMLKNSEDIFDRMAAAFLILRVKDKDWYNVPPEEVEFAYKAMNDYYLTLMPKEEG